MYSRFLEFAAKRQKTRNINLSEKIDFSIKKYEDCIHYYVYNSLNYHLIYYYKGKIYFG
jgi:hypothetical protein